MESKKVSFFNKLSFIFLFASIFGSIIFFLPYVPVTLEASKGFFLSVGVMLSLFFWLIARLGEGKFVLPKDKLILSAGIIPLVFLIASFFSSSVYASLFGSGFEVGTFGSILVLFLVFFLSSVYFQSEKKARYFYGAFFIAASFIVVFEIINLFYGFGRILPGLLQGISSGNLIGSWNDFALFIGLVIVVALSTIELMKTRGFFLVLQYFLVVIGVFFLVLLKIPLAWLLVGIFAILITIYSISTQRTVKSENHTNYKFPFVAFTVFFICFIFLIGNNSIGALISRYITIPNTDVRPSIVTTSQIAWHAIKHNPLLGTGPNTFSMDWALWQPKEIASTIFWNSNFSSGFSSLSTFAATTGILGLVAFLIFMVLFLIRGASSLNVAISDKSSNYLIITTFLVALYSWTSFVIYNPNILMMAIAFASSGLLVGILVSHKKIHNYEVSFLSDPRSSFFSILGLVVLMVATASTVYVYAEKFSSVIYFSKSLNVENTTVSLSKSEQMLLNAITLDKNDVYYRTLSNVYIKQLALVINDKTLSQDTIKSSVKQLIDSATLAAQSAVSQNPKQYLNYVNLGDIYSQFVPLSVTNSYEGANASYDKAITLSPNNPSIILSKASLELLNKNNDGAKKLISQALTVKPNYIDAIFLLAQIYVSEGNNTDAIKQAEYAATLAPSDSTVFFRLGLLRYNNSDYSGAVSALETSVILDNTNLQARYYLAQAYAKSGRSDDAKVQFDILNKVVPNNQDIKDALNSISAPAPSLKIAPKTSTTPTKSTIKK